MPFRQWFQAPRRTPSAFPCLMVGPGAALGLPAPWPAAKREAAFAKPWGGRMI